MISMETSLSIAAALCDIPVFIGPFRCAKRFCVFQKISQKPPPYHGNSTIFFALLQQIFIETAGHPQKERKWFCRPFQRLRKCGAASFVKGLGRACLLIRKLHKSFWNIMWISLVLLPSISIAIRFRTCGFGLNTV